MIHDYEPAAIRPMTSTGYQDATLHRPPMTPAPSQGPPSLKRRRSSAPPQATAPATQSTILQTVLLSKLSYTIPSSSVTIDFPVGILMAQVLSLGGLTAVTARQIWGSVLKNLAIGAAAAAVAGHSEFGEEDGQGLADLYTKSVKPWEPSVFAGLLGEWVTEQQAERPWTLASSCVPAQSQQDTTKPHEFFAPAVPSAVSTPLPLLANANVNPFNSLDLNLSLLSKDQKVETPASGDFEALLASMQEDQERAAQAPQPPVDWYPAPGAKDENQLPTPPQDKIAIRRESECTVSGSITGNTGGVAYSPISMANGNSPYDSSSSTPASEPVQVIKMARTNGPKHIGMPTEPFKPPPPMCMYFHSGFYDLQKDKIGVWRGELNVLGDSFSIMVVGEEGEGKRDLWQTEKWKSPLSFPSEAQSGSGSTGDLITVTDLVRQGLVPLTMGMVLCDGQRPGEIDRFVRFVASLHSTGTAFRLSSNHPLPIVFIPSKFHAEDPLQRLGIAVMGTPPSTKPAPAPAPAAAAGPITRKKGGRRSTK